MGFLEEIFKKRAIEKHLEKSGSDVKKIKKLLSGKDFHYVADYVEQLKDKVRYLKSPYEILTPIGIFEIPLIIETKEGYTAFLPSLKKLDRQAIKEYIAIIGFLKKTHYFNSNIIIAGKDRLPPVLDFYTSRLPFVGLLLSMFVDATVTKKDRDPLLVMVENFQDAFHVKLGFEGESLKLLDKYLSPHRKIFQHEILNSGPMIVAVNIFHEFMEKIFQKEMTVATVESGKIRTGATHILRDYFVLAVDFKGKFYNDMKKKGEFSFYDFFEDTKLIIDNPHNIPQRENMPFLEWKILTDQLKNITRPMNLKNALDVIKTERREQLQKFGPLWGNGWCDLFYCPHCHTLRHKFTRQSELFFQSLTEMKECMLNRLTYKRGKETGESCSNCGEAFTWDNVIYSQLQYYLTDCRADLQLNYDRLPTGHYFYMWQALKEEDFLSKYGTDFDNKDFTNQFGREFSLVPFYNSILERCLKTRKAETEEVADGYHLFAVPPVGEDNPFVRNALEELTTPLKKSKRNYMTFCLNLPKNNLKITLKDSFIKWTPDFIRHLTEIQHQLIAIVDMDRISTEFERKMIERGIVFHLDKKSCYMDDGKYRLPFDFTGKVWKMVQTARYIQEYVETYSEEYITRFQRLGNLFRWMNEQYRDKLKLEIDRMTGVVSIMNLETNDITLINIYEFVDRWEISESRLKEIIETTAIMGEKHSRLCECGSPSNLTIRLISPEKLEEIKGALDGEEPVVMGHEEKFYVFRLGCPTHSSFLTRSEADKLLLDDSSILNRVLENIQYDSFNVDLVVSEFGGKEIVGVIGEDAATLGTDAKRVQAVLSLCYQSNLNDKVTVFSNYMEILLIADKDISSRTLTEFSDRLIEKLSTRFEKTYRLNEYHHISIPPEGAGRINVLSYEYDNGGVTKFF